MKKQKFIYKIIFIITCLIFIISPQQSLAVSGDGTTSQSAVNEDKRVNKTYKYYYFDFSKFQYTKSSWDDIIIKVDDEDIKSKYSQSDDYDHFESSEGIEELYPLITGTIIINTTTNPGLFTEIFGKDNNNEILNNRYLSSYTDNWTNMKNKYNCQDFKLYFNIYKTIAENYNSESPYFLATDVNLKYYKCLHEHLQLNLKMLEDQPTSWTEEMQAIANNSLFANKALQFVAGMHKEISTTATKDYWNNNFKSFTVNKSKVDLILSDNSKKMASGACYEANPSGTDNRCADMIFQTCPTKTANGKGKIHFLYGITCKDINPLIKAGNYKAKIVPATELGKKITKEREEIEVKIQVPFAGIKDGIDLPTYINEIYKYLISVGFVIAGIILVLGGLQYIGQQPDNGKKNIQNAIIGIILLSSSYTILQVINPNTLDLSLPEPKGIKGDPFSGELSPSSSSSSPGKLNIDCSSIPGPNVKPTNEKVPAKCTYNFNYYKKTKNFNPMCVLSDKALNFDSNFTTEKIQELLEKRNSILAALTIKSGDKRRPVSEAIYNIAKSVDISPQLLLVKLHKEQSLLSNKILKKVTENRHSTVSSFKNSTDSALIQSSLDIGRYIKLYHPLFVAMGYGWRDGDNAFMPKTATEIDDYLKSKGLPASKLKYISNNTINNLTKLYKSQKKTLTLANGYIQTMGKDLNIEDMTWGERYVRARVIEANKKLAKYFGEIKYTENTKAIDAWGGLDRQIYLAASGMAYSSGVKGLDPPLDYIGASASSEAQGIRHGISKICPGNRMTAVLYSYTPHVSAQKAVFNIWKSLGFDESYLFPKDECQGNMSSEWLQIGQ